MNIFIKDFFTPLCDGYPKRLVAHMSGQLEWIYNSHVTVFKVFFYNYIYIHVCVCFVGKKIYENALTWYVFQSVAS